MAFPKNGVIAAPKIVPSAFGLLAVVDVENSADEDHWIRGFSQEWETDLYALYNVDETNSHETQIAGAGNVNYYDEIKPFFIEVQEDRSTLGFLGIDRIARISRQLEATSQRAIEEELWDGAIRITSGHANRALVSSALTVVDGEGLSAKRSLAALEHGIAQASHAGEQGIIHATRDVVAALSSNSQMLFHNKIKDHLQTMGGTPVVTGSGYSGNGPKWDVLTASVNGNKLILVTNGRHYFQNGDRISLSITSDTLGTVTLTNVEVTTNTGTEFKVDYTHANVTAEDATGYAQQLGTTTDKWIYATGTVKVYLGNVDVVNDNLSQAYDVSGNANDMRLKAIRPAAAYFDTSIHLAVRVDLTA
jgi:hypothetical protein